jgi:uncharacterized protein (DUF1499 family)
MLLLRIAAGTAIAMLAAAAALRLLPSDPAVWHVDPVAVPAPATPNAYRVGPEGGDQPVDAAAPVYALPSSELAARLDALAMAQPRVTRLARSADGCWATYVARSRVMGFPDYVSVRVIGLGEASSTLAIFSRARFGRSDLGVNEARVKRWLAALAPFER